MYQVEQTAQLTAVECERAREGNHRAREFRGFSSDNVPPSLKAAEAKK